MAHTMIGYLRLNNFRRLIETAILDNIAGAIIETGVWRGGACIMARAARAIADPIADIDGMGVYWRKS